MELNLLGTEREQRNARRLLECIHAHRRKAAEAMLRGGAGSSSASASSSFNSSGKGPQMGPAQGVGAVPGQMQGALVPYSRGVPGGGPGGVSGGVPGGGAHPRGQASLLSHPDLQLHVPSFRERARRKAMMQVSPLPSGFLVPTALLHLSCVAVLVLVAL